MGGGEKNSLSSVCVVSDVSKRRWRQWLYHPPGSRLLVSHGSLWIGPQDPHDLPCAARERAEKNGGRTKRSERIGANEMSVSEEARGIEEGW